MTKIKTLIQVPHQHRCFPGHFPDNPIVPGALLLQWILDAIRNQLRGHKILAVSSLKFHSVLKPGDSCELEARLDTDKQKIRLHCQGENGLICKAILLLEPAEVDR